MLLQFALIPVMMIVLVRAIPIQERGLKDTLVKAAGKYTGKATFFHPDDSGSIGMSTPLFSNPATNSHP
jgi:hypothetical protein